MTLQNPVYVNLEAFDEKGARTIGTAIIDIHPNNIQGGIIRREDNCVSFVDQFGRIVNVLIPFEDFMEILSQFIDIDMRFEDQVNSYIKNIFINHVITNKQDNNDDESECTS